MRRSLLALFLVVLPAILVAQARKFPPDSLVNTQVIPHGTPVTQVIGTMRNFAGDLGVRCQFCHVGREGMPLDQFDFASDDKREKLVARQMMRMVAEINRRLDTLPGHGAQHPAGHDHAGATATAPPAPLVTCRTCHHGVSRPVPLQALLLAAHSAGGVDSAMRAYRALRGRYYGRDAYDFGEPSLNITAFRLARAGKIADGLALLSLNEEFFPGSSTMSVFRGNILLMRGDSNGAAISYREAVRRDSTNDEARGRLREIRRTP